MHSWVERSCGRRFRGGLLAAILELQKANPGNDVKVMAGIRELVAGMDSPEEGQTNPGQPSLWERASKAAGGTSDGMLQLLRDEEPLYQRLLAIMALPLSEYERAIKQFGADIRDSPNPFVVEGFGAWEKCRVKEFSVLAELAMVRAAVEYKLHGEPGLMSVTDPCGKGPFTFKRFIFEGVDRGFQLKSAYEGRGFPEVLILVEKEGAPFRVNWKTAGQALSQSSASK